MKKPCGKCGSTDRYRSGGCKPCHQERSRKRYLTDKENKAAERLAALKLREEGKEELGVFDKMNFEIQRELYKKYKKNMNILKKRQRYYRTGGWRKK